MPTLRPPTRPNDDVPTSSMADIAFLLLIFFLVTTVFPRDQGMGMALPQDETEVSADNVLELTVHADGRVTARHGDSPFTRSLTPDEVQRVWRDAVALNPGLIAALRSEPETSYADMIAVLDRLHLAGAERISLGMVGR
ncbi:MAG TPA: biopolymer transporter ExbD [Longimicrobiales bacterium]|nr:biopolymer transporter ExbD [Longimicrobiales bacterium]